MRQTRISGTTCITVSLGNYMLEVIPPCVASCRIALLTFCFSALNAAADFYGLQGLLRIQTHFVSSMGYQHQLFAEMLGSL
jgi:hypothetical protein